MKSNDYIYISSVNESRGNKMLAEIGLKGGSITRLQFNDEDKLWQNPTKVWPRKEKLDRGMSNQPSPILFPSAGSLKNLKEYDDGTFTKKEAGNKHGYLIDDIFYFDNTTGYFYNGKFYPMSKHGFARLCKFNLIEYSNDRCVLRLDSSYKTLKYFPFNFKLDVMYKMVDYGIDIEYKLKNTGNEVLPFNIGDHPGFALKKPVENYYLEFDNNKNAYAEYLDINGIKKVVYVDEDNRLGLNREMFSDKKDAVRLYNIDAKKVSLCDKANFGMKKPEVIYDIDSDSLVLWSADPDGLLCIEPWYAKKGLFSDIEANMKNGNIKTLKPNEEFSYKRRMRFPDEEYAYKSMVTKDALTKRLTYSK